MGVRTPIDIRQANELLEKYHISFVEMSHTVDGISDTTYIGTDHSNKKYVFKIYESADATTVQNEINLLNFLAHLPVPRVLLPGESVVLFEGKPTGLFSYLEGDSVDHPTPGQVSQIGAFLGAFHRGSQNMHSINPNYYTHQRLAEWIGDIRKHPCDPSIIDTFSQQYESIRDLSIETDCVIHGDLFPDNAKFVGEKLTGVFDFVEACMGNSFFDLSVVANSWCFDPDNELNLSSLEALLSAYAIRHRRVDWGELKRHMLFASLFYAVRRFHTRHIEKRGVNVKDHGEYIAKFDRIFQATL